MSVMGSSSSVVDVCGTLTSCVRRLDSLSCRKTVLNEIGSRVLLSHMPALCQILLSRPLMMRQTTVLWTRSFSSAARMTARSRMSGGASTRARMRAKLTAPSAELLALADAGQDRLSVVAADFDDPASECGELFVAETLASVFQHSFDLGVVVGEPAALVEPLLVRCRSDTCGKPRVRGVDDRRGGSCAQSVHDRLLSIDVGCNRGAQLIERASRYRPGDLL